MDIVPATTDTDISAWTRTQPLPASMAPVPAGTFETPKPAEPEPAPTPEAPKPEKPVTETGPELDAALDKRKAETAATIKGIEENMLIMRGLMRPIAPPALPRFQDVPKSPDYQLRSGFEAFQNPLTWLAIGGSLLTRRPAIAAMGAAAGAMEGFHQGDNERVKLEQKKFQDQMQAALEQNNKEVQFFNATMANKKFSAAERSAQIEAFFHQNRDLVAIDALKSGNYDRLFEVFKLRATLNEKAHEIETRWGMTAGGPNPEATAEQVRMFRSTGENRFAPVSNPRTPQALAISNAFWAEFLRQGGTPEEIVQAKLSIAEARGEASARGRVKGTREENLRIILDAANAAIPAALEQSQKVARTGWVPINRLVQKGQAIASDEEYRVFGMANLQLAEHWARAMNPQGIMRESDRDKALEFLSTAESQPTYRRLVMQLKKQIEREKAAVQGGRSIVPEGAVPDPFALSRSDAPTADDPLGIR